ncbi:hypothetical protein CHINAEXTREME_13115 [Halobiforma lacisalsi AJ5]|uniref:DUF7577 domain-containing protein n=2 Tax=Natronobacterium lacisalsi TaxID=229731 RepID=M0LKK9_NATLA|nr:hypothetical protein CHINAEXTREME_13115 [Halobiforma lacisalsi AJ5]EMA32530.1 hypothetical protein C445_10452 [Halobiforma lacisalsi AJ5]
MPEPAERPVMSPSTDSSRIVSCRRCRTENEVFYTYCRNCLETLPNEAYTTRDRSPRRRGDRQDR